MNIIFQLSFEHNYSLLPSFRQSFRPSIRPFFLPSSLPSFRPFFRPSIRPSVIPCSILSVLPSFRSSVRPSVCPPLHCEIQSSNIWLPELWSNQKNWNKISSKKSWSRALTLYTTSHCRKDNIRSCIGNSLDPYPIFIDIMNLDITICDALIHGFSKNIIDAPSPRGETVTYGNHLYCITL